MTTNQIPTEFTFSKATLNAACATFENDRNITLRDTHTRGLILRKQAKDWHFGILRKINSKVHRVTIEPYTATSDLTHIRTTAARIMLDIPQRHLCPRQGARRRGPDRNRRQGDVIGRGTGPASARQSATARRHPRTYARALLWLTNTAPDRADGRADIEGTAARCTLPIAGLTTDTVRAAYDRLCNAGKVASGNSMLRSLRAIWNTWADETDSDGRNPITRITAKRGRVQKVAPRTGAIAPDAQGLGLLPWKHKPATAPRIQPPAPAK